MHRVDSLPPDSTAERYVGCPDIEGMRSGNSNKHRRSQPRAPPRRKQLSWPQRVPQKDHPKLQKGPVPRGLEKTVVNTVGVKGVDFPGPAAGKLDQPGMSRRESW